MVQRFFCHQCSLEIPTVGPDFTCPTCRSGFIGGQIPYPSTIVRRSIMYQYETYLVSSRYAGLTNTRNVSFLYKNVHNIVSQDKLLIKILNLIFLSCFMIERKTVHLKNINSGSILVNFSSSFLILIL